MGMLQEIIIFARQHYTPYVPSAMAGKGSASPWPAKAQLRLMINDDEHLNRLDTFIEQLTPGLNHLLIVTKRRKYYQDMAAWLLKENGLVVEMADTLGPGTGQGHILIDFHCDNHKDYQWYPKNLIVMPVKELALDKEFLGMRRRDICVEEGNFWC